ncbi:cyclase family protein [Nocardioides hungaricus]
MAEDDGRARAGVSLEELLADAPRNWGRWGSDDELGALNYLTPAGVLRAITEVRSGEVFTLGTRIGGAEGEPVTPERSAARRWHVQDHGTYTSGDLEPLPGGLEWADDKIEMFLQGTTHYDGIGHAWYGDRLYNGYPADDTIGHMRRAGVLPIAQHGVVGRGVLVDIARHRGAGHLGRAEPFELEELLEAAATQGVEFRLGDILLVRTGWVELFYEDRDRFYEQPFHEPGLVYTRAVSDWFHDQQIAAYGTDTVANEIQPQPESDVMSVLHAALMRNLGVAFNEILWLPELAGACAGDARWSFLYCAAPLKVVGATGAPVNPLAIR